MNLTVGRRLSQEIPDLSAEETSKKQTDTVAVKSTPSRDECDEEREALEH